MISQDPFLRPQGDALDFRTLTSAAGSLFCHSLSLNPLPEGGRWEGQWCLLDTLISPRFLEEPKKSCSFSLRGQFQVCRHGRLLPSGGSVGLTSL